MTAKRLLLGDEAVAWGAIHAGLTAAYAYPGTPSTEIMETLVVEAAHQGTFLASWCANEKTAYEQALGVSSAGGRSMVIMKHVGLNVAADAFINSALVAVRGGLVLAVADDPGMHSSQNEQDSRFYADFAHIICMEPADAQQAYDMTRAAFALSERFRMPVMVRMVTRLCHGRDVVVFASARDTPNATGKTGMLEGWNLLPAHARRQWRELLERQRELVAYTHDSEFNQLALRSPELGVLTTGIARQYLLENLADTAGTPDIEDIGDPGQAPSHLHIGAYPAPVARMRALLAHVKRLLVLEEGYPLLERQLRGVLPPDIEIHGKLSGQVPATGELTPEIVRRALGLPMNEIRPDLRLELPPRPPRLCAGCPHGDAFQVIKETFPFMDNSLVTSDIGCYTLGALPPYSAIESCVCMGASIGMAKGAVDAGLSPVVAVIGDGTFLHSGMEPLLDAVANNTPMTVIIMHNEVIAMTGAQSSLVPSSRMEPLLIGLGVAPEHVHVLRALPGEHQANADILRRELDFRGLSVIVFARECVQSIRLRKRSLAQHTHAPKTMPKTTPKTTPDTPDTSAETPDTPETPETPDTPDTRDNR